MREVWVIGASLVGFLVVLAFLGRGMSDTTATVNYKVQIGQLQGELAGARAECETLRANLEKCRAELKQASEARDQLKKRIAELEKRPAKSAK